MNYKTHQHDNGNENGNGNGNGNGNYFFIMLYISRVIHKYAVINKEYQILNFKIILKKKTKQNKGKMLSTANKKKTKNAKQTMTN